MNDIIKLTVLSSDPVDHFLGKIDLSVWLRREARRLIREGGNK